MSETLFWVCLLCFSCQPETDELSVAILAETTLLLCGTRFINRLNRLGSGCFAWLAMAAGTDALWTRARFAAETR